MTRESQAIRTLIQEGEDAIRDAKASPGLPNCQAHASHTAILVWLARCRLESLRANTIEDQSAVVASRQAVKIGRVLIPLPAIYLASLVLVALIASGTLSSALSAVGNFFRRNP